MRVLGEHQANAAVMQQACGALHNIGSSDEALQKRIAARGRGIAALVRAVLGEHQRLTTADAMQEALRQMLLNESGQGL